MIKVAEIPVARVPVFNVRDKFREGEEVDGVRIARIGPIFKLRFLGKQERRIAPSRLWVQMLLAEESSSVSIVERLGNVETPMAQSWEALALQGKGQRGYLRVDLPTVTFSFDTKGDLCSWYVRWLPEAKGWYVGATPIDSPNSLWERGAQVLSRPPSFQMLLNN
jgi:hypothetical protein